MKQMGTKTEFQDKCLGEQKHAGQRVLIWQQINKTCHAHRLTLCTDIEKTSAQIQAVLKILQRPENYVNKTLLGGGV